MKQITTNIETGDTVVTTTSKELNDALQIACHEWEKAVKSASAIVAEEKRNGANKALAEYNAAVIAEDYAAFYATPNPIATALKAGTHTIAKIAVKTNKDGVTTITTDVASKIVDIADIDHSYDGKGCLFPNGQWKYWIEKFAYNLNLDVADNIDAKDKGLADYAISDMALKSDLPLRVAKNGSNTQLVAQLQKIMDAIVFVDDGEGHNAIKVTSADLAFLREQTHGGGKALNALRGCNKATMIKLFTRIAYTRLNGLRYELACKSK